MPLDRLDPAAVMRARNGSSDEPLYVICRSGSRGRQACEKFLAAGLHQRRQRRGRHAGLRAKRACPWCAARRRCRWSGRCASRPGRWCCSASLLGWLVHPAFLGLSAFVGAGLVFAGITDTCGMGMLLARMPWNQVKDAPACVLCRSKEVQLMKLVIVGGVAGGASAAARARRLSEDAEIILFERGPDVSFANCGLPYYVGGEIAERDKLLVVTPERLRVPLQPRRADPHLGRGDRPGGEDGPRPRPGHGAGVRGDLRQADPRTGAAPLRPPIPGIDLPGVFTLRNLQDVDRIKARVDQGVKQAVVVGAGFIGLELVENFVRRGIATTVVELQDQVLPPFDKEMTTPIAEELASQGRRRCCSASPPRRSSRRRTAWSCG